MTYDLLLMTLELWPMTYDIWPMTYDLWPLVSCVWYLVLILCHKKVQLDILNGVPLLRNVEWVLVLMYTFFVARTEYLVSAHWLMTSINAYYSTRSTCTYLLYGVFFDRLSKLQNQQSTKLVPNLTTTELSLSFTLGMFTLCASGAQFHAHLNIQSLSQSAAALQYQSRYILRARWAKNTSTGMILRPLNAQSL